jgi:NTE family protein
LLPQTVLVLGGGNGLAVSRRRIREIDAQEPRSGLDDRASAGVITGALIAGNPPERRVQRLREFWAEAATKSPFEPSGHPKLRQYYNGWHVAWAALSRRQMLRHARG